MPIIARFPLAVIRSALTAKKQGFYRPDAIYKEGNLKNVHCGEGKLIATVGVYALAFGGIYGVQAYVNESGNFAFPG